MIIMRASSHGAGSNATHIIVEGQSALNLQG